MQFYSNGDLSYLGCKYCVILHILLLVAFVMSIVDMLADECQSNNFVNGKNSVVGCLWSG